MASDGTKPWEAELAKDGYIKVADRPNPYGFQPAAMLWNGVTKYGARLNNFFPILKDKSPLEHQDSIRSLPIRDDDVIIAAYLKSGTHWLWEVTNMLLNKTTSYEERSKEFAMLEFCDQATLAEDKSPRVLNAHLWMPHLPQEILKKKTKIIHVVRNPKSILVSFYFHINGFLPKEKQISLDTLLRTLIDNNLFQEENQLEYLRHMSEFQKANPDHPVLTVYYEDMKKNPLDGTKQLAEFLGVQNTDDFYKQVVDACGFDKMKNADSSKKEHEVFKGMAKPQLYRKGTIGDWKNHLTVAQNEMIDAFIEAQFKKGGLPYQFTYV